MPSADVFVRICDVHPAGRSMTVCDGIRRIGSIGTATTDPQPPEDGLAEVEVPLWPTFHRFEAGHHHRHPGRLRRGSALRPQPRQRRTRRHRHGDRPRRAGDLPRHRPRPRRKQGRQESRVCANVSA
ncbi:CocE/NonD family hydrolase C-terminal non-catalytic domain-containing protein [Streptomyces sp. RB17]|uniref:CocE/NonD family hydrolase C-terminal non-catalytic domain-containing protein n=1 Tax=Streptomyces sp. RB17 TaxID=2585197 RepID=UPI003A4C8412